MTVVMPSSLRLRQTVFEPVPGVQQTPLRGGGGIAIDFAPTRWRAEFASPSTLSRERADAIAAFLDSLVGGLVRAEVFDWLRKWPRAYGPAATGLARAIGGTFDGDATVSAIAARSIGLSGLPAGFRLRAGDMIGLREGSERSLHRIGADVTASAGGIATVGVYPAAPVGRFVTPTARLVAPTCIMTLVEAPATTRDIAREGASFKFIEVPD